MKTLRDIMRRGTVSEAVRLMADHYQVPAGSPASG